MHLLSSAQKGHTYPCLITCINSPRILHSTVIWTWNWLFLKLQGDESRPRYSWIKLFPQAPIKLQHFFLTLLEMQKNVFTRTLLICVANMFNWTCTYRKSAKDKQIALSGDGFSSFLKLPERFKSKVISEKCTSN